MKTNTILAGVRMKAAHQQIENSSKRKESRNENRLKLKLEYMTPFTFMDYKEQV